MSALLTGVFMVLVVIPRPISSLWVTLFLTSLALALCLPSCATLLSVTASERDQGRVMGNNQALQVGAESLSGLLGGLLAAVMVKLSLIVLEIVAIVAVLFFNSRIARPLSPRPPQSRPNRSSLIRVFARIITSPAVSRQIKTSLPRARSDSRFHSWGRVNHV